MQIIVNGSAREVGENSTVADLIEQLALNGRRLAIEINTELVPRSRFEHYRLSPGDRIEVIHAVGGG